MGSSLPPLILASGSPRRRELLRHLGIPYEVEPSAIDESPIPGLTPAELVRALALAKARDVASRRPEAVVIGADTLVDLDGHALAKPRDADDALRMLRLLAGRAHQVHTGVAVCRADQVGSRVVSATVYMRRSSDAVLAAYVAGGEPMDKAGAYAAQGEGAVLIDRVEGSFLTVIGLPLLAVRELLGEAGLVSPADQATIEALEYGGPSAPCDF
jgi:septum formation protein